MKGVGDQKALFLHSFYARNNALLRLNYKFVKLRLLRLTELLKLSLQLCSNISNSFFMENTTNFT